MGAEYRTIRLSHLRQLCALDEMAAAAGREGDGIERSVHWFGVDSAEDYHAAGATIFVHEIAPDPITGYDFTTVKEMLSWRDHHNE